MTFTSIDLMVLMFLYVLLFGSINITSFFGIEQLASEAKFGII